MDLFITLKILLFQDNIATKEYVMKTYFTYNNIKEMQRKLKQARYNQIFCETKLSINSRN